jgi:hypothetical protein
VFFKHNERGVISLQTVIQAYLDEAKIGRKQSYNNFAVFPLLSGYAVGLEYLTLDEALTEDLCAWSLVAWSLGRAKLIS